MLRQAGKRAVPVPPDLGLENAIRVDYNNHRYPAPEGHMFGNLARLRRFQIHLELMGYEMRHIFGLLYGIKRLTDLMRWATRQRRTGLVRFYLQQRDRLEHRLSGARLRSRALVACCELLFTAYLQLQPDPSARRRRRTTRRSVRRRKR